MPENRKYTNITCISCSIFRDELNKVLSEAEIEIPVKYINSMLHLEPEKLREALDTKIDGEIRCGKEILLLFGDCHHYMDSYKSNSAIKRVCGVNCIEILIGKEKYQELTKDGAFFFINEWSIRWREIFESQLGLNENIAKSFMQDMHKYLLYINTGLHPVPTKLMDEASEYLGLSWKILDTDTETLKYSLLKTLQTLNK